MSRRGDHGYYSPHANNYYNNNNNNYLPPNANNVPGRGGFARGSGAARGGSGYARGGYARGGYARGGYARGGAGPAGSSPAGMNQPSARGWEGSTRGNARGGFGHNNFSAPPVASFSGSTAEAETSLKFAPERYYAPANFVGQEAIPVGAGLTLSHQTCLNCHGPLDIHHWNAQGHCPNACHYCGQYAHPGEPCHLLWCSYSFWKKRLRGGHIPHHMQIRPSAPEAKMLISLGHRGFEGVNSMYLAKDTLPSTKRTADDAELSMHHDDAKRYKQTTDKLVADISRELFAEKNRANMLKDQLAKQDAQLAQQDAQMLQLQRELAALKKLPRQSNTTLSTTVALETKAKTAVDVLRTAAALEGQKKAKTAIDVLRTAAAMETKTKTGADVLRTAAAMETKTGADVLRTAAGLEGEKTAKTATDVLRAAAGLEVEKKTKAMEVLRTAATLEGKKKTATEVLRTAAGLEGEKMADDSVVPPSQTGKGDEEDDDDSVMTPSQTEVGVENDLGDSDLFLDDSAEEDDKVAWYD